MTSHVTTISESERDIRWREWQARGAASDRRTAKDNARIDDCRGRGVGWVVVGFTRVRTDRALGPFCRQRNVSEGVGRDPVAENGRPASVRLRGHLST
jgi:hypothetical protein